MPDNKNMTLTEEIMENINRLFVGKTDVVEKVFICLLAGGHILIEDVPGVGKTTLARVLSGSVGCSMGRIQFTPDTLPGDIVGMSVYNMKTGEFEHRDGVIMNQILLADEINRTSPKTQSALLEAMAEGQVTVDGVTYTLPKPFLVIATQNPIEFLGTYPLPEAQMDRFMMRICVGYPEREQEILMASKFLAGEVPESVRPVCKPEDISELQKAVAAVKVNEPVLGYIEDLMELTRKEQRFVLGASPRAMLSLIRASQAYAFLRGRDYVKPDDVKQMAEPVLLHRMVLTSDAKMRKENAAGILKSLIIKAKVPVG